MYRVPIVHRTDLATDVMGTIDVEAHGWEIEVVEGVDGGARFEITSDLRPNTDKR